MDKIIYVNRELTSTLFFNSIISEVQIVLKYYDKIGSVIIDFSGTKEVAPNVIPNLLCLGRVMQSVLGKKAIIRIPDTYEGGKLKNYLYNIKFIQKANDIFRFESDPYTGFEGKKIDPLCGTVFFDKNVTRTEIEYEFDKMVGPFADKYLSNYNRLCLENGQIENKIVNLLKELAINSMQHGESYSYTTIHAKYSDRKIYISISDSGRGFLNSCLSEHLSELESYDRSIINEVDAILYCIYLRKESKIFGLYSVIRDTISIGGTVRIHSNNDQIVFTKRIKDLFEMETLQEDVTFKKFNVRNGLVFSGTHIEIEVPF